jgi:hypothetical protein
MVLFEPIYLHKFTWSKFSGSLVLSNSIYICLYSAAVTFRTPGRIFCSAFQSQATRQYALPGPRLSKFQLMLTAYKNFSRWFCMLVIRGLEPIFHSNILTRCVASGFWNYTLVLDGVRKDYPRKQESSRVNCWCGHFVSSWIHKFSLVHNCNLIGALQFVVMY